MFRLKNLKFWVLVFITSHLTLCTLHGFSAENIGAGTAKFLKIGTGSRAAGMGGAFAGVCDNVEAIYWNPAGLAQLKDKEFGLTYMQWFEDIMSGVVTYGQPLPDKMGAIGISVLYWSMGTIEKTTDGVNFTSASVAQGAGGFTYSRELMESLLIGMTIKGIYQDLAGYYINGLAGDVGLLFRLSKDINLGLNVQNLGTVFKQSGTAENLPSNLKAGIAFRPGGKSLTIAVDLDKPFFDNELKLHVGAEYYFEEKFALRAGWNQAEATSAGAGSALSGFTAGLGYRGGVGEEGTEMKLNMEIDYAYIPYGTLGTTHRLTVIMKF